MSEKTLPPKSGKPSTVSESGTDSKLPEINGDNAAAGQPALDQSSVDRAETSSTSTMDVSAAASEMKTTSAIQPVNTAQPLTPELDELLSELKETVKQFNARRLNTKTLRRSLVNVRSIIDELEALLNPKPSVD